MKLGKPCRRGRRHSQGCQWTSDHRIPVQRRTDACGPKSSPGIGHVPGVNGTDPGYRLGKGHSLPGRVYASKTRPR
jgi:hypothetical protein